MTDSGILGDGTYYRQTFDEILDFLKTKAQERFGSDVDLSETSVLTRILATVAARAVVKEQTLEEAYNSAFLDTAKGLSLSMLVRTHFGIDRTPAAFAQGSLRFSRPSTPSEDIVIPAGTLAQTVEGLIFETDVEATITTSDTFVDVLATAVEEGAASNAASNTIKQLTVPIAGVTTVNNPAAFTNGRDAEVDIDLRDRAEEAGSGRGKATLEGVRTALRAVTGVTQAIVIENDHPTDTDPNGVPPGSIHPIVTGGDEDDIAQALFESKCTGVHVHGTNTQGTATDPEDGQTHTYDFTRPTAIDIYVKVTAVGGDQAAIENSIIQYIGGVDNDGITHNGLTIGRDVVFYKVVQAVMEENGVESAQIFIDTSSPAAGTSDISIGDLEFATTELAKLDVTVS